MGFKDFICISRRSIWSSAFSDDDDDVHQILLGFHNRHHVGYGLHILLVHILLVHILPVRPVHILLGYTEIEMNRIGLVQNKKSI